MSANFFICMISYNELTITLSTLSLHHLQITVGNGGVWGMVAHWATYPSNPRHFFRFLNNSSSSTNFSTKHYWGFRVISCSHVFNLILLYLCGLFILERVVYIVYIGITNTASPISQETPRQIQVWKSTHISMISNSVTHLQSYTNSAIAGNSARSLTSPHLTLSTDIVALNEECLSVSWCFTMF